jgi:hypothetical protein
MAEAHIQVELVETKAELQWLRRRISTGTPIVHKDLSLISLVPRWSCSETAVPLEGFFSSFEGSARVGNGRMLIKFKWQYLSSVMQPKHFVIDV